MEKLWLAVLGAGLLAASCGPQTSIPQGVQVDFSPNGGVTEAVVKALSCATNDPVLAKAYLENWRVHEQPPEPCKRASAPAEPTGRTKRK